MAESEGYDITVIGGGPGGYVAAIRAAQLGAQVALVEKDRLGGTCLNRGCIPTKALLRSAEVLREAGRAGEFGVDITAASANLVKMMARKNSLVDASVAGVERLLRLNNVALYRGTGRIVSPRLVTVSGDREIATRRAIIATGSVPATLPVPGLDLPGVVTSDELLNVDEVLERLVIIGGGVIGLEFACLFHALGTRVTVVEMLPRLLPAFDEEIVRRFSLILRRQGIEMKVEATLKEIRRKEQKLEVVFDTPMGEQVVEGEKALLAVGRSPYTDGLGLAELGVEMQGAAIAVNERLETNVGGIYAIGDAVGGMMLAHVASYEGEVAVENALGGRRQADYQAVPNCLYTSPEVASIGMTEEEVEASGREYKVSRFPFSASSRAQIAGETDGLVKVICDVGNGKVLGVHILGLHASALIAEAALLIKLGGTAQDLAHTVHAHPTLSEALREAALGQLDGSIHFGKI